jgi:nucleoside 2-deoxyribosyltransferase
MTCPICSNADAAKKPTNRDASIIDCPQCGNFTISGRATAVLNIKDNFATERWKISAWVNEFKPELITTRELETAVNSARPTLHHRADLMLRWITTHYPPGTSFKTGMLMHRKDRPTNDPEYIYNAHIFTEATNLIPAGWNQTFEEMKFMITAVLCDEMKLLSEDNLLNYQVSAKGILYLEGRRESVSSIGFCAMWFSEEVQPLWKEVIEPAITAAGYEALRIDSKQHNGKIDDEIMASIRASKFVVSDFTGSRGGVYYEAGFAHGLGLPVIFMCRESDLKDIHFDVRQYNCILWTPEKLEEAQSQLKNRILATLGQGPKLVQ